MEFTKEYSGLIDRLMAVIRSATQLSALDVGFVRSLSPELAARSEEASGELLTLINALIAKSSSSTGAEPTRKLHTAQEVVSNWRSIEQSFDLLMDKIDSPPQLAAATAAANEVKIQGANGAEYMKLGNKIAKPQLKFRTKVDNSLRPFKPWLTTKPFATELDLPNSLLLKPADADHEHEWYDQPYRLEIARAAFPEGDDTSYEFPSWEETPLTVVDTPEKLFKMVAKLEQAKAVAIDVEHHDYRSYLGIVCLLQISALGEDYVVDALALRSELQVLNRVTANPGIVKVLHGAKMDVMWLQRDLGVYIVNMFDTYFAARELQFPKLSLAYLLQRFVNFEAQKEFQLADWRVRPLPQELVDYARADTHFLLYIYGQLRNMLHNRKVLEPVVQHSREVAAFRYELPGWNEKDPQWYGFVLKYRLTSHLQRAIAIRLLEWRDAMARKHDESTRYVMSPAYLANLCVTKPNNGEGVLAAGHSASHIVRDNATDIAKVVQRACREEKLVDTTIPDIYKNRRARFAEQAANEPTAAAPAPAETTPVDSKLKILHSQFMGDSQPSGPDPAPSRVFLGVFDDKDLSYMIKAAEEDDDEEEEQEQEQEQEPEPKPKQKPEPESEEEVEAEAEPEHNQKGKRLNLVDNTDDIELSSKMAPAKKTRKVADEPAFDFNSASRVMGESAQDSSYQRFGNQKGGPRGAHKNSAKFKKGRSFRN